MLMRNTTTSAFNDSLLPSHNLPGDSRINHRIYLAVFVQRDPPLNSNSTLSGIRSGNQPQFSVTKASGEISLRVPKQSHPGVPFQLALDIISFEDMSEGGINWAPKSIESQNLKLSNIQSLAIPYTQSGTMHARQGPPRFGGRSLDFETTEGAYLFQANHFCVHSEVRFEHAR